MNSLANYIGQHYKRLLLLSILMLVVGVFFSTKLSVSSSFEDILPEDSQVVQAMEEFEAYFPSQDKGIIVVKGQEEEVMRYLPDIVTQLEQQEHVKNVFYRIDFSEMGEKSVFYGDLAEEGMYFSNEAKNVFLLFVEPQMDVADFATERKQFYKEIQGVITDYDLEMGLTGGAFIQDYEADTVAFDGMGVKVMLTLVLVLVFVMVMFRNWYLPLLTVVPLILGIVITSGIAYGLYGSLNMFSISFTMLLIGLGIDFGVHMLMRIMEKEFIEKTGILHAIKTTGTSILVGAVTTSIAFLAFTLADFKAFEQMGVISGIGIMVLSLATIILLPSLLILKPISHKPLNNRRLTSLLSGLHKSRYLVIGLLLVAIIVVYPNVKAMSIQGDMDKIYPQNISSRTYSKFLEESMDYDVNSVSLMVEKKRSLAVIQALSERADIKEVHSIYDFLPPNQSQTVELLKSLGVTMTPVDYMELPSLLQEKYLSGPFTLLEITPNFNIYDQKQYQVFKEALEDTTGQRPVGMAVLMNEVIEMTKKDIVLISEVCLALFGVTLLFMFRSLKKSLVCLLPVVLTVYMTIGILPYLHLEINIFSITAFPLILGIGIDSAVHLMHRLEETNDYKEIAPTVRALFITAGTTIIGFGSLGLINHPGMANLGITVALGMVFNLIFTLILIPSIMGVRR